MAKTKTQYVCNDCGGVSPQWAGKCSDCGAWNSLTEVLFTNPKTTNPRQRGYAGVASASTPTLLPEVEAGVTTRYSSGISELDRVLGGGIVAGAVVLLGGDPGIGKSTLLLQCTCSISINKQVLYLTGEESLEQVSLRAKRLGLSENKLHLLAETQIETIINVAQQLRPEVLVIDSIQTIFTDLIQSAPGSVSQVRESAAQLVRFAKQSKTTIFLVGHVTKDGALAGPRVLEHMVDTVLYFEGERDARFRALRAVKNRFGAVNELGIFAMTEKGLREVTNPSAIFVSKSSAVPGSVIMTSWEGSRPLMLELQALVDESHMPNPRRVAIGLDPNRLTLVLAVLSRYCNISSYNRDVFVNVVGGLKITETAIDVPLILAILSSIFDKALPPKTIAFGEVGLTGEIRPVQHGQERLKEAQKLGYEHAIVPAANVPKDKNIKIKTTAITQIRELIPILK